MPYGFQDSIWKLAKDEATKILIQSALVRGTIPYSELVSKMKTIDLNAHDFRLFHLLGEISAEEDAGGRGMLSVIVVHKHGDMQPGPGFFDMAKKLGKDTSDILACWIKELKVVHDYWSRR